MSEHKSALEIQHGGNHYKGAAIEPAEFIHRNGIGFLEGCVIKRMFRFRMKNGLEDLKKAKHEIDLIIEMEYPKEAENNHLTSDMLLHENKRLQQERSELISQAEDLTQELVLRKDELNALLTELEQWRSGKLAYSGEEKTMVMGFPKCECPGCDLHGLHTYRSPKGELTQLCSRHATNATGVSPNA